MILKRGHRGSILIIALWVTCFLATLAVIISGVVKQKVRAAKHLNERAQSRYIAEAGIKRASIFLASMPAQAFYALKDTWSSNPELFRQISVGQGTCSIIYQPQDAPVATAMRYGMIDEERKININLADIETLRRLFQVVLGCDEANARDMAACIIDWRDADNQEAVPMGGAEDSYYLGLTHPYRAKNAPFESMDELPLVKGFERDVAARVEPFLTLYGSGQVNVNTASVQALIALGMAQETASNIIRYRKGPDETEGTGDDLVFAEPSAIATALHARYPLSAAESETLKTLCEQSLAVGSTYFTIKATARLTNNSAAYTTTCVADANGVIQYWSES
jgi:general secretion pathway protein K